MCEIPFPIFIFIFIYEQNTKKTPLQAHDIVLRLQTDIV